jgi:hypothetical protein
MVPQGAKASLDHSSSESPSVQPIFLGGTDYLQIFTQVQRISPAFSRKMILACNCKPVLNDSAFKICGSARNIPYLAEKSQKL